MILSFKPKDSTAIKLIGWDSKEESLIIQFQTLSVWAYYDVPIEIYDELINSKSLGNYFNKNIRNNFRCVKLVQETDRAFDQKESHGQE